MTDRCAHSVQSVLINVVTEPHLAVQRMFLVVADEVHKTLKLCRTAQHEEAAFLLDTTVFDLPLCPGGQAEEESKPFSRLWTLVT